MTSTITNEMVDTRLTQLNSTIAMTRVTNVATLPAPLATVPLEFNITASSTRVWMTYEQLLNTQVVLRLARQAERYVALFNTLKNDLNAIVTAMGSTPSEAKYRQAIQSLRAIQALQGVD